MSMQYDSAVIGLGPTGFSCVRHLLAQGERLLVTDSRKSPPALAALTELPDAASSTELQLGAFQFESLNQAKRLVFSPGVDRLQPPFAEAPLSEKQALGDIQLFADARTTLESPGELVVITGTNGKSTVSDLTRQLLVANKGLVALGGNYGTPALDLLQKPDVDYWVLELSSFQLDLVTVLHADIAVLLNIGLDHKDRHPSFTSYAAAKKNIFKQARLCIWNRQQAVTRPPAEQLEDSVSVGLDAPLRPQDFGLLEDSGEMYLVKGSSWRLPLSSLRLVGLHNAFNVLCALACAEALTGDLDAAAKTAQSYQGLEHRLQQLAKLDGVRFVNDSKATNIEAAAAALSALATYGKANILLLAGGRPKEADFDLLAEAAKGRVRHTACFGEAAPLLMAAMQPVTSCTKTDELHEAFAVLADKAVAGDILLLSPACSSYDQFSDFAARGDAFARLVQSKVA